MALLSSRGIGASSIFSSEMVASSRGLNQRRASLAIAAGPGPSRFLAARWRPRRPPPQGRPPPRRFSPLGRPSPPNRYRSSLPKPFDNGPQTQGWRSSRKARATFHSRRGEGSAFCTKWRAPKAPPAEPTALTSAPFQAVRSHASLLNRQYTRICPNSLAPDRRSNRPDFRSR